jgi:hypothetical protein
VWEKFISFSGSDSGLLGKSFPLLAFVKILEFLGNTVIIRTYDDGKVLA